MIYNSSWRRDVNDRSVRSGSRGDLWVDRRPQSTVEAIKSALHFELGYGGQVVKFEPTQIDIETRVMSKVDHTVFEGSEEDMTELFRAVGCFLLMRGTPEDHQEFMGKLYDQMVEQYPMLGRTLYLVHAFPLLAGGALEKRALVLYLARTEDEIKSLVELTTDELYELIEQRLNAPVE